MLYIEPGSPWENGYIDSFNGKLRDELLNREVFDTLLEAKVPVERWRREYNQIRPHLLIGVSTSCAGGHYADGSVGVRFRSAPLHLIPTLRD
jgi:transposase InsO family protein